MLRFDYALQSDSVDRALAAWQAALGDHTEAFESIADDFRQMLARQFATEGRAEGTPWAPRRSTGGAGIARSRMFGGVGAVREPPLLVRTGALLRSLTQPGAPGHVQELDATSLLVGSRLAYGGFHQTGTRRLPARPLIVLSGARLAHWTEVVRRQLEERMLLLGAKELGS